MKHILKILHNLRNVGKLDIIRKSIKIFMALSSEILLKLKFSIFTEMLVSFKNFLIQHHWKEIVWRF